MQNIHCMAKGSQRRQMELHREKMAHRSVSMWFSAAAWGGMHIGFEFPTDQSKRKNRHSFRSCSIFQIRVDQFKRSSFSMEAWKQVFPLVFIRSTPCCSKHYQIWCPYNKYCKESCYLADCYITPQCKSKTKVHFSKVNRKQIFLDLQTILYKYNFLTVF